MFKKNILTIVLSITLGTCACQSLTAMNNTPENVFEMFSSLQDFSQAFLNQNCPHISEYERLSSINKALERVHYEKQLLQMNNEHIQVQQQLQEIHQQVLEQDKDVYSQIEQDQQNQMKQQQQTNQLTNNISSSSSQIKKSDSEDSLDEYFNC